MVSIKVLDNQTGGSLPNAHVYPIVNGVPDYTRGSSTNLDGNAQINATVGEWVQVTFIGFEDQRVAISPGMMFGATMIVRMNQAVNQLGEALVFTEQSIKKDWTTEIVVALAVVVILVILANII